MAIDRSRSDCTLNPARAPGLSKTTAPEDLSFASARNESAPAETAIDLAGVLLRPRKLLPTLQPKAPVIICDEFE
jgi:hypothetical protein